MLNTGATISIEDPLGSYEMDVKVHGILYHILWFYTIFLILVLSTFAVFKLYVVVFRV